MGEPLIKLDYEPVAPRPTGWLRIISVGKFALIIIASLVIFVLGMYALNAVQMQSDLLEGQTLAPIGTIIYVVLGLPISIVLGFIIRPIVESLLRRQLRHRTITPWLTPALAGIVALVAVAFSWDHSPKGVFHKFLKIDPPASVSDFKCWWTTLPGDMEYAFRFKIDPADFDKLLVHHTFVEHTTPYEIQDGLRWVQYARRDISLPPTPPIKMYEYSNTQNLGPHQYLDVFTNAGRDEVVICGDN